MTESVKGLNWTELNCKYCQCASQTLFSPSQFWVCKGVFINTHDCFIWWPSLELCTTLILRHVHGWTVAFFFLSALLFLIPTEVLPLVLIIIIIYAAPYSPGMSSISPSVKTTDTWLSKLMQEFAVCSCIMYTLKDYHWWCRYGHCFCCSFRLVSGAGDIKLTKDGNVLLHEMVRQCWNKILSTF